VQGTILIAVLVLALSLVQQEANGETITVSRAGHGDHRQIQSAIDASQEGDTIRVWEGSYYENIVVDRPVDLVGNGSEVTMIHHDGNDMSDNVPVVRIESDEVHLSGLYIYGGYAYSDGLLIESSRNTITDNLISGNRAGIRLSGSKGNTFMDNIIRNNDQEGIHLIHSDNNVIYNNLVSNNGDNGIHLGNSDWNILRENICSYHDLQGIELEGSHNNAIIGNICLYNGQNGMYLKGSHRNLLSNNTSVNNHWIGIHFQNSDHNELLNNNCSYNGKDGISLYLADNNILESNECWHNNQDGIYMWLSEFNRLERNTCLNNLLRDIFLEKSDDNILIQNVMLEDNGAHPPPPDGDDGLLGLDGLFPAMLAVVLTVVAGLLCVGTYRYGWEQGRESQREMLYSLDPLVVLRELQAQIGRETGKGK